MLKKALATIIVISLISILVTGAIAQEKVKAIIVFKDKPAPDDLSFLKNQGAVVRYQYNIIPGLAIDIPLQAIDRIREMCQNPKNPANPPICTRISYIEPDQQVTATSQAGAISASSESVPWGIDRVDAELAWATSTGNGIKIAAVDTGIDYKHPDLDANVKGGATFCDGNKGLQR